MGMMQSYETQDLYLGIRLFDDSLGSLQMTEDDRR